MIGHGQSAVMLDTREGVVESVKRSGLTLWVALFEMGAKEKRRWHVKYREEILVSKSVLDLNTRSM
jgi:hypothetical protein